jgi:predicted site-specific integrase-resolvase
MSQEQEQILTPVSVERYIPTRVVLEMLSIGRGTLDRWVKNGDLTTYRALGTGDFRFKISDIEAIMVPSTADKK